MKNPVKRNLFRMILVLFSLSILITTGWSQSQTRVRTELKIPDISGYVTLRCDFHMHTVFSDGYVWPTIRPLEAYLQGLDVIAITEHIEYRSYKDYVHADHNQSYELAKAKADELGIICIRGAEITRPMPPGHFNAIFLTDANLLDQAEYPDAFKAALEQGAFIFWNHPGWRQPDEKAIWYEEHTTLYEKRWFHGIEVVNGRSYYPEAHAWALEKKLTMLGNSDIHEPITMEANPCKDEHRPVTLVFVKKRTPEAIKEALFARRTAVYSENLLIGEEAYLRPMFEAVYDMLTPEVIFKGKSRSYIQIRNRSDIPLELATSNQEQLAVTAPASFTLYGDKVTLVEVKLKDLTWKGKKEVAIPMTVKNWLVAPQKGLEAMLKLKVAVME